MQKLYSIPLTSAEIDHLRALLESEKIEGSYYGNKEQHYRRRDVLIEKLESSPRWQET